MNRRESDENEVEVPCITEGNYASLLKIAEGDAKLPF